MAIGRSTGQVEVAAEGSTIPPPAPARRGTVRPGRRGRSRLRGREGSAGWVFVAPLVIILGLFLVLPIFMAAWVSVSDWSGSGSPFSPGVHFVGARNYQSLLTEPTLQRTQFATSIRNNAYYVLLVVPLQTGLALSLALVVNNRRLRGLSFFRTAFYFPTVTSSVAIIVVFLFLFSADGSVNALLGIFGINGPTWLGDPQGLTWTILGGLGLVDPSAPPAALAGNSFLGVSWFDWLAGPSTGMC